MAKYETAYAKTMIVEAGYANHVNDTGGETWGGISRKNWPYWVGWLIVDREKKAGPGFEKRLLASGALEVARRAFYVENFWNVNRLSDFNSQSIANELFDTGVNMSPRVAAEFLQRALNLLNRNGKDYADIQVDGVVGGKTIALVNGHRSPQKVFDLLNTLQGAKYIAICEKNKSQEAFLAGWLDRVWEG